MYDGPPLLFGGPPLAQTELFKRTCDAVADRKRRRDEWLAKRRQELKELARATIIDRVLHKRTQQCAAKRSGDPSLAVGRRSQAKDNAECRKEGIILLPHRDPIRSRLPSLSAIPAIAEMKSVSQTGLFDWSELQTGKTTKWYYRGKSYTVEELRARLRKDKKLKEHSLARKKSHKTFQKSMQKLEVNLKESIALQEKGIAAVPQFRLQQTSKTTLKARQASVHEWKASQAALALAEADKMKRRPSIFISSLPEVTNFALPEPVSQEDEMDCEWNNYDVEVNEPHFEMPTIQDFNATPLDKFESVLKGMSMDLLKKLKDHVKAQRPKTGVGADQEKWDTLIKVIGVKHKENNTQGGNNNGQGKPHHSNGSFKQGSHNKQHHQSKPWHNGQHQNQHQHNENQHQNKNKNGSSGHKNKKKNHNGQQHNGHHGSGNQGKERHRKKNKQHAKSH